ncbi:MAG TPA: four-carbon acid sugar kinase family protein [Bryobacteraceae bacterium]|nr:four-carbon acid sugar kinase family protein [Bryobacteraceae bacterium]
MILVLADDMTGALEVGAVFANRGFQTVVCTVIPRAPWPEVLVVDTETRHCTSSQAFDRIVEIGQRFPDAHLIYKKTDSTLRGNIRPELEALLVLFPQWRVGYAPAYPEQGRTVRDGMLFLNGIPLCGTEFARDPLNPVTTSSVGDLLGADLPCTIFDGASDLDVENAAKSILADSAMRFAAGPTALASELAHQLQPQSRRTTNVLSVQTCLVLNGSRTELAQSQISYAVRSGCVNRNEVGPWVLVEPTVSSGCSAGDAAVILAGTVVDVMIARSTPDAVLIIGGDTAYAFVSMLDNPPLEPITEVIPGVAVSRISRSHLERKLPDREQDLILITKAGGFGEVDVVCRTRQLLGKHAR